jgi:hypothetical protein
MIVSWSVIEGRDVYANEKIERAFSKPIIETQSQETVLRKSSNLIIYVNEYSGNRKK